MADARPIIVGYDGSNTSALALVRAVEVAEALSAQLHVVTVANAGLDQVPTQGEASSSIEKAEQLLAGVEDGIDAAVEIVTTSIPSLRPGVAMRRYASDIDAQLIIIGNLRSSGLRRLLGSLPDEMAVDAPCDVMIVKTSD